MRAEVPRETDRFHAFVELRQLLQPLKGFIRGTVVHENKLENFLREFLGGLLEAAYQDG
jgi:hypothetical protein